MIRKDFVAIANVIKESIKDGDEGAVFTASVIAYELASVFKKSNPKFERHTFIRACGLE